MSMIYELVFSKKPERLKAINDILEILFSKTLKERSKSSDQTFLRLSMKGTRDGFDVVALGFRNRFAYEHLFNDCCKILKQLR